MAIQGLMWLFKDPALFSLPVLPSLTWRLYLWVLAFQAGTKENSVKRPYRITLSLFLRKTVAFLESLSRDFSLCLIG